MQLLIYWIVYPFLLLISLLPFRILYLFSDFIYLLVYYVIGYRKKVVRKNLAIALPNLSEKERLVVEKKSYRHLCDMFLEMAKTMTISEKEMNKRFVLSNLDEYLALEKEGKSISLMCAHYASYEWALSLNSKINFQSYAIYKKVNNPYFDKLAKKIRSKFKATLINNKDAIVFINHNERTKKLGIYGFVSDQSPQNKKNTYWSTFLGIEVPVFTGAEMLSKKFDMNMVYLKVNKVKRGYYEAEFEILAKNTASIPNYEVTLAYLRKVEEQIYEAPEFYLWTHNRFKHMGKLIIFYCAILLSNGI